MQRQVADQVADPALLPPADRDDAARRRSAPSRCTSGWLPCSRARQPRHVRHGRAAGSSFRQSRPAARSSASVVLPTPGGPARSSACGMPEASIAVTAATAAGWPRVRNPRGPWLGAVTASAGAVPSVVDRRSGGGLGLPAGRPALRGRGLAVRRRPSADAAHRRGRRRGRAAATSRRAAPAWCLAGAASASGLVARNGVGGGRRVGSRPSGRRLRRAGVESGSASALRPARPRRGAIGLGGRAGTPVSAAVRRRPGPAWIARPAVDRLARSSPPASAVAPPSPGSPARPASRRGAGAGREPSWARSIASISGGTSLHGSSPEPRGAGGGLADLAGTGLPVLRSPPSIDGRCAAVAPVPGPGGRSCPRGAAAGSAKRDGVLPRPPPKRSRSSAAA